MKWEKIKNIKSSLSTGGWIKNVNTIFVTMLKTFWSLITTDKNSKDNIKMYIFIK